MAVQAITDKASFMSTILNPSSTGTLVVCFVDETDASQKVLEIFEKAATKSAAASSDTTFYTVNISAVEGIAEKLGTSTAPITVIYKGGVKAKTIDGGYDGPALKAAIDELK